MDTISFVPCECGYELQCTVQSEGEFLDKLVFIDAEESSETYAEQVSRCPGCQEWLGGKLLAPLLEERRSRRRSGRSQAEDIRILSDGS